MKQIILATKLYLDDNRAAMVPLWVEQGASGWPGWTFDAATFIVSKPTYLWWPDKLRLDNFIPTQPTFSCPVLTQPATAAHGQSFSSNYTLGIGMNYPEYGAVVPASGNPDPVYASANEGQVGNPASPSCSRTRHRLPILTPTMTVGWKKQPLAAPIFACQATRMIIREMISAVRCQGMANG